MESQNFYLGLPDFGLLRALVDTVPWEAVLRGRGCRKAGHSPRRTSQRHRNRPSQFAIKQASRQEDWSGWTGSFYSTQGKKKKKYLSDLEEGASGSGYTGRKSERPKVQLEFNLASATRDNNFFISKYINNREPRRLSILYWMWGETSPPRMRKRLRYLMPSLLQFWTERPVIIRVSGPLSWKRGTG